MKKRDNIGEFLLDFPENYTIIDLETSGLDFDTNYIIEVAALKIRNGKEIARFETLVHPPLIVEEMIESLTGITNQMLRTAPVFSTIAESLWVFLENEVLVGHHVDFDITFLYDGFAASGYPAFSNFFVDTLPISQKLFPELIHHRLSDMAAYYQIDTANAHRAMADCYMNFHVFEKMKASIIKAYSSFSNFSEQFDTLKKRIRSAAITASCSSFDCTHPLYQKNCVITGALRSLSRKEALTKIANWGGINQDKLNTLTDILIVGNTDYCDLLTDLSKKQKKALRLIDEGYP
ncbi:MAG: exonuclease domain-containing protein, partial [Acetivibrio sp.]